LERLLEVRPPPPAEDFAPFWRSRLERASSIDPQPRLSRSDTSGRGFRVFDLTYDSTDSFEIHGWLLQPESSAPTRGFVMGHGYGGIEGPDFDLPFDDAVYVFPCFRGLSRSRRPPISDNPVWHVLHDIDKPERYILGGCVEDLWLAVSSLLLLYPALHGHVGYMGISFGGGIGAMAMPWDPRIGRVHLNVPSFGY